MPDSDSVRQARHRDKKRGGPARVPKPCGTYAAWMRHKRRDETPCDACREAYNAHQREMHAKRQQP